LKSPIHLLRLLLAECGERCCVSTDLDLKRIEARFEREGFSFLAITLATFGKDFQQSLEQGYVSDDLFLGFKKRAGLPELFRGFLQNVFEPGSGHLRSTPCVDCIISVRQLSLMWAKVNAPASPEREEAAFTKWMECESDVQNYVLSAVGGIQWEQDTLALRRVFGLLFAPSASRIDKEIYQHHEVRPKHGPGSVAERTTSNGKYAMPSWPSRLERVFPAGDYAFHSYSSYLRWSDDHGGIAHPDPGAETPSRIVSVPKTLDAPRIIAMEPVAMQYMQQAIKDKFEDEWEKPSYNGRLNFPHHFIRYFDQTPNQRLAKLGSELGTLATLDLSEASDRVPNALVIELFKNFPHLNEAIQATRSLRSDLGKGRIIELFKFASMGSALTFPIESMVFLTVVFWGIEKELGVPLSYELIKTFIGHVRVYGDDIIVPVEFTRSVIDSLENFGFKVNRRKSFWNGKFRESCGKDYYDGEDVSIVRLRRGIPSSRRQTDSLISFVEFRNQLYKAGYWKTIREIDQWIERLIPFPAGNEGCEGLTKISYTGYEVHKMDRKLQRPLVRGMAIVPKKRKDPLNGEQALMKFFVQKNRSKRPIFDREHLVYAGRPVAVDIKHRWLHPDYGMEAASES